MYLFDKFYIMFLFITTSFAYKTVPMTATTKPPPLCVDCKHFLPPDIFQSNRADYGHCRQFYDINLVTGEKKYDFASIARSCETMCGVNATYFESKRNRTRLW